MNSHLPLLRLLSPLEVLLRIVPDHDKADEGRDGLFRIDSSPDVARIHLPPFHAVAETQVERMRRRVERHSV